MYGASWSGGGWSQVTLDLDLVWMILLVFLVVIIVAWLAVALC